MKFDKFEISHLIKILDNLSEISSKDFKAFGLPDKESVIELYKQDPEYSRIAFSLIVDESIIGIAGIKVVHKGVAQSWIILSNNYSSHFVRIHKASLEFHKFLSTLDLHRIYTYSLAENSKATKWYRKLGYEIEGKILRLGVNKEDFNLWRFENGQD